MDCRAATMAAAPGVSSSSSLQCDYWPNMSITRAITNKWFSNPFTLPSHSALSSVQTNKGCTSHRKNKTKKSTKNTKQTRHKFFTLDPNSTPWRQAKIIFLFVLPSLLHAHHIIAWVTRPEHPKGAKDEVKLARRATN